MPLAEILVVDDGSTDESYKIARRYGVPAIRLPKNKGIGVAVREGLRVIAKHKKSIVIHDGDGQHDPKATPHLLRELDRADIVIASRYIKNGQGGSTFLRKIGSILLSYALFFRYKKMVYDPTSGFRALSSKAVDVLISRYPVVFPEPEVIAIAIEHGLAIKEIPVAMRPRMFGASSISLIKACTPMWYTLKKLLFAGKKS